MADIEPPTFSLGLDLDIESEPRIPTHHFQTSTLNPAPNSSSNTPSDDQNGGPQVTDSEEEEEEIGPDVMDSDPEPGPGPTRVLRRLRRGPATQKSKVRKVELEGFCCDHGDDDIEEFSSQEDLGVRDAKVSTQFTSVCSSSKVPLKGCGVLTSQSPSLLKGNKKEQASIASVSSSLETDASGKTQKTDSSSKKQQPTTSERKNKTLLGEHRNEDLWKDFCPIKSYPVQTPVLDEMCNEYFQSLQDNKNKAHKLQSNLQTGDSTRFHQDPNSMVDFQQCWNLADPLPPAHHYFFHEDLRIQRLVHSRLPYFFPLGIVNNKGNQLITESAIDYMSQFNREASRKQGTQRTNSEKGSTRGRNKSKKSNAGEVSLASEGWVDPKSSTAIPKDAGKRRVHASDQGDGHWYTSPEGRKVYISKNGQELSGQIAYRHYKKDSGGFRRSKKKTNTKGKGSQSQKKTNAKRKRG
ncbi:hypothetical protein POPTR_011G139200v4 [Populus trichocarpa]|uniref:Uncharacterized protein n=1 Tax=Populus trichocarpa TaxID=3694 RepID=A0ACC0S9Y4_POPTR|nr:hypothetical protein POPTR_011G139200v4 [Populus trichocarpa]|eukprot:XP_024437098.1 uncharacterized protein LOC7470956 isoform X2 [Populus trichocarpa]